MADTGNPRCRSTLPVPPQRCRGRLYACRLPGDGKCVLSAKETVPASPKTAPRGVTAPLALLPITPLSEAISPALRWVQWPSLRCDEPDPRMSIPAVTAPQYCRPVLLTQQTLRPCSARAGQTARHAIDRTPSRRLRRVANRETQAGYRAQVGLGREGNEGARASFAGISIPLRAGPVIPVCGSMDA